MRRVASVLCLLVLVGGLVACDDAKAPADMAMLVDATAADATLVDMKQPIDFANCKPGTFQGFPGVDVVQSFECPCGCLIDTLTGNQVSSRWSVVESDRGLVTAAAGVGVSLSVSSFGAVEFAGISSISGTEPFFLDGDFEISVDYAMVDVSSDASVRLIVQTDGGPPTGTFVVERTRDASGADRYEGLTGEVAAQSVVTGKTSGTLTMRRVGSDMTAIADGQVLGKLTGGSVARFHIIVTAGILTCGVDAGSCHASAVISNVRLANGTLINVTK